VIQCLVDSQQSSITEFVYLVEAHHHLNLIFIPKDNSPRRLDDGVVMLVLEARGHPLRADAQLFVGTSTSDERIDQAGFGVVGHSSLKGFHQPCLKFTIRIWALPMSSSSDDCACSSGAISSSISRSARVNAIDGLSGGGDGGIWVDPEALGARRSSGWTRCVDHPAPEVIAPINEVVAPEHAASTGLPSSTAIDQDAPSPSNSQNIPETQTPVISNDIKEDNHDLDVAHMNNDPFIRIEES
nr:hypothetical protein [Tanacetum cinerariifolium]